MRERGSRLKPPMSDARSGSRPVRRWRVLVAHDATLPTCDALILGVERAYGNVEIIEAASVEDALVATRAGASARDGGVDLCLVCLDLPPAPQGGTRLAEEVLARGIPLVLVTRSLRWLPADATLLRAQPWVSPEAEDIELARAMGDAIARAGLAFDIDGDAEVEAGDEGLTDEPSLASWRLRAASARPATSKTTGSAVDPEDAPADDAIDEVALARASQVG